MQKDFLGIKIHAIWVGSILVRSNERTERKLNVKLFV